MKKLLVAVDGSEGANRAARFAAQLARETQASIELLHVYDAPAALHLGLRMRSDKEVSDAADAVASGSIQAAQKAMGDDLRAQHHVMQGYPADEIVKRAREIDADLIVVGFCGLRDPEGAVLGGVGRRVLQRAGRPVIVVP